MSINKSLNKNTQVPTVINNQWSNKLTTLEDEASYKIIQHINQCVENQVPQSIVVHHEEIPDYFNPQNKVFKKFIRKNKLDVAIKYYSTTNFYELSLLPLIKLFTKEKSKVSIIIIRPKSLFNNISSFKLRLFSTLISFSLISLIAYLSSPHVANDNIMTLSCIGSFVILCAWVLSLCVADAYSIYNSYHHFIRH